MNKKYASSLLEIAIVSPFLLELFIFQCFRFADWRNDVSSDIQFRILWGSLGISLAFILYYTCLFIWVLKSDDKNHKANQLFKICLFAILGISTFLIHYFI